MHCSCLIELYYVRLPLIKSGFSIVVLNKNNATWGLPFILCMAEFKVQCDDVAMQYVTVASLFDQNMISRMAQNCIKSIFIVFTKFFSDVYIFFVV